MWNLRDYGTVPFVGSFRGLARKDFVDPLGGWGRKDFVGASSDKVLLAKCELQIIKIPYTGLGFPNT